MHEKKCFEYRHIIFSSLILLSVAAAFFFYPLSLSRTYSAFLDLVDSLSYYFQSFSGEELAAPSVSTLPEVDLSGILPFSVAEIERKLSALGAALFDGDNFKSYLVVSSELVSLVALLLLPVVVLLILVGQLFNMWLIRPTKREGDTKALSWYKRATKKSVQALLGWFYETSEFLSIFSFYPKILLAVWLFNLNLITIGGEALAFYFYFAASLDVGALLLFFVRLLIDALIMLSGAPWPFWMAVAWLLLCKIREGIGYDVLEHHERENRGFVNALPAATMIEGTMGSKKTTGAVDMGLSCAIVFRQKALELMMNNDLRFPAFPWASLRSDFRAAILNGEVYNLTTVERWVRRRHALFHQEPMKEKIWGYDYERYPMEYSDDLKVSGLWDVAENYCKEFYLYAMNSSLIVANFSVREDLVCNDCGSVPAWDMDIFHRDPRYQAIQSRYAHILDFDLLRFGKRMVEDAQEKGFLDCGIVLVTEIGKERGNQNTLKELKRLVEECNQRNDKFEDYLKMIRHPAVVDNFVFIKVITDDQRAASWAADGRELCTIVNIVSCSETKLALPLFIFAEMAYDFAKSKYDAFMFSYDAVRKDMCLPVYLYRQICAFFFARHERACNRFGYYEEVLETENGKQDGSKTEHKYYLAKKKIYSNRFATNCHKGLFTRRALRASYGLDGLPEYAGVLATDEELDQTHSHFISAVRKDFDGSDRRGA